MGKILDEVKEKHNNKKKEEKVMKTKNLVETLKTIAITVLVTGIAAFALGVHYEKANAAKAHNEAAAIVKTIKVEVEPSKQ